MSREVVHLWVELLEIQGELLPAEVGECTCECTWDYHHVHPLGPSILDHEIHGLQNSRKRFLVGWIYNILNFTEFNSDCVLVLIALDSGHSGLSGFPENPVNHWSVKGQSGPTLHGYPFGQVYLLDCRSGQVDPAAGMSGEGQGLDFAGALYYLNILLPLPPALVCFLFLAVLKYPSALVNNPI